jgi:hypothetical protein
VACEEGGKESSEVDTEEKFMMDMLGRGGFEVSV